MRKASKGETHQLSLAQIMPVCTDANVDEHPLMWCHTQEQNRNNLFMCSSIPLVGKICSEEHWWIALCFVVGWITVMYCDVL